MIPRISSPSIENDELRLLQVPLQQNLWTLSSTAPTKSYFHVYVPPRIRLPSLGEDSKLSFPTSLAEKLFGDVAIATAVTAVVAPFLTVVDKALVERSAGTQTLLNSAFKSMADMARHPVKYFKSPTFLFMWATYASTYSMANSLRTLTEHQEYTRTLKQKTISPQPQSSSQATIFLGTSVVNTTASIIKDRAYARLFGNAASASASIPKTSYGLWVMRDFTVIGSSFCLPPMVAQWLREHHGVDNAQALAQFGTPLAAQLIAGPLHFVGLDCYNRNLSTLSVARQVVERSRFLVHGFAEVVLARMARILPGYSMGGVWNAQLRSHWRDYLIERQVQRLLQQRSSSSTKDLVALIHTKQMI